MTQASDADSYPSLVVSGGPYAGVSLRLLGASGERLIGSGKACHLRLPLSAVEPTHALLRWDGSGVFLYDAKTRTGTFVNGRRLEEVCPLGHGDRICLGPPRSQGSADLVVNLPSLLENATAPTSEGRETRRGWEPPLPRALLVAVLTAALTAGGLHWYGVRTAPAPVLLTLSPAKAEPGQTVAINGSSFDPRTEGNQAYFDDQVAEVRHATQTQLEVVVPPNLQVVEETLFRVGVAARGLSSNVLFFKVYLGPHLTALEPEVALPGHEVTALGENLDRPAITVLVGGLRAQVLAAKPRALRFRVPALPVVQGKTVPVIISMRGLSAPPLNLILGKLPLVLEVSPARGLPGDRVTVKGRGFDPAPGGSVVTFSGRPAAVIGASATELMVVVPGTGLGGPATTRVAVRAFEGLSTSATFTLTHPSSATFVPRFFPEPVSPASSPQDRVFVSTDLRPVLLLGGRGDAVSTAERAARVVAALNEIVEEAGRQPVALEFREKPDPSVGVAGNPRPLVTATAEDADGYAELSDLPARGRRPSLRSLAQYWTALLQDHVALFAQNQRPTRVLELSPRGKALLDIYAEAQRRAEGEGVPLSVVQALTPAQLRGLREMALVVPGDGESTAAAAAAGRWKGVLEDADGSTRPIQVRIRVAGSGIAGWLTTRSGSVAVDLPLDHPAYDRGTLSFTVRLGRSPLRFRGQVEGKVIAGPVEGTPQGPAGRLTLRWVE